MKKESTFNYYLKQRLRDSKFKRHFERYNQPVRLAMEIVRAREKAGLTQGMLGKRVGISTTAIARLESADDTNLKLQTVAKIARALRPHFSFFIGDPRKLAAA